MIRIRGYKYIPFIFLFFLNRIITFVISIEILQNPLIYFIQLFLMKDFVVSVRKVTDESLMQEACEMTFLGKSRQQLLSIYKSEHSPARTQLFWITAKNIPLFIATHLLRHHVGSVPFQLTCRDDRKGGNPGLIAKVSSVVEKLSLHLNMHQNGYNDGLEEALEDSIQELEWLKENSDRYTPVNLGLFVNAQSLIDMAKLRLCLQAHKETVLVFQEIKKQIELVDPALSSVMVRKCVYRGGICGESTCCGFNNTPAFKIELEQYLTNFSEKQQGLCK
ncbi:FAD-dependent thymidylate synthase [Bacteroides sp. 224]|uniref:FAD-dependent thymidylate synthase n=1 Tax=Bacteroides sp. 224 TaxID=2302936 RepID=UPI0013D844BB|nr:FAD-dependent thymidylate synthase [Bacteroides sp. 224]NDV63931.1 hypothetical protein [Bacteroides sp. 224]